MGAVIRMFLPTGEMVMLQFVILTLCLMGSRTAHVRPMDTQKSGARQRRAMIRMDCGDSVEKVNYAWDRLWGKWGEDSYNRMDCTDSLEKVNYAWDRLWSKCGEGYYDWERLWEFFEEDYSDQMGYKVSVEKVDMTRTESWDCVLQVPLIGTVFWHSVVKA